MSGERTKEGATGAGGNIFVTQPEFIADDPRTQRPEGLGYKIDADFMRVRHQILLPGQVVADKTVLDLGSCNAATGAWCLSLGAKHYTGVELQDDFVKSSVTNLSKYYPTERWEIVHKSIEDFFAAGEPAFDVVVASGVLHAFSNVIEVAKKLARMGTLVVIDAEHPGTLKASKYLSAELRRQIAATPDYVQFIENEPFISLQPTGMGLASRKTIVFSGYVPSMGALRSIFERSGFAYVPAVNEALKKQLPKVYSPVGRYGLAFVRKKTGKSAPVGLSDSLKSQADYRVIDWET